MKAFRHHEVVPLQAERSSSSSSGALVSAHGVDTALTLPLDKQYLPCLLHAGHSLSSFCLDCEALVCSACIYFSHSGHNFALGSDHVEKVRYEMLQNRTAVEKRLADIQTQLTQHQGDILTVFPFQQSCLATTFEQLDKDLARTVSMSEQDIYRQIEYEYTRKCAILKGHLKAVEEALERREQLMTAATAIVIDENNFQVNCSNQC
jgi:hypothetical protein